MVERYISVAHFTPLDNYQCINLDGETYLVKTDEDVNGEIELLDVLRLRGSGPKRAHGEGVEDPEVMGRLANILLFGHEDTFEGQIPGREGFFGSDEDLGDERGPFQDYALTQQ